MPREKILNLIQGFIKNLDLESGEFVLEHPTEKTFGDYSTNAALVYAKKLNENPKLVAEKIKKYIEENLPDEVERIEIAGPGFINFYLTKEFFKKSLGEIIEVGNKYGKNKNLSGQKIMVEYTDPNILKPFHIGHLMSNAIGESISRIMEWNGADVIRVNYYSDSGLNIAKAVWGMKNSLEKMPDENESALEKAKFLGESYACGVFKSSENEEVEKEVREINIKIFQRTDNEINKLYDLGKRWSLEHFNDLYEKLGSTFDLAVGESEVADEGKKIVLEFMEKGIFERSDGAIVFHGEKYNSKLHTRVFINKENLPTYEAKELGLTKKKFEKYGLDQSIVITANEQNDYFKVVLEAIKQINKGFADKTKHLSHGLLRLTTGKMSSRTGNVITAVKLIDQVKSSIQAKGDIAQEEIAIGAIKYMILRQSIGHDIIFDFDKSVSVEGDSGPYLQYAFARTNSLLEKAGRKGNINGLRQNTHEIEKLLYRFPEIIITSMNELAPNYILTYLTELSGSFNNFYAEEKVISDEPESEYRLAIVEAFNIVLKNGLDVLGIPAPERM